MRRTRTRLVRHVLAQGPGHGAPGVALVGFPCQTPDTFRSGEATG